MQLPDTFYVAIHARQGKEQQIRKTLATIYFYIKQQKKQNIRVMVLLFSNRLEAIDIIQDDTISKLLDFPINSNQWQNDEASLNGIINIILGDCVGIKLIKPSLFIYTDESPKCYWNLSTLSQMVDIIWLKEQFIDIGKINRLDFNSVGISMLQDTIGLLVTREEKTKEASALLSLAKILIE